MGTKRETLQRLPPELELPAAVQFDPRPQLTELGREALWKIFRAYNAQAEANLRKYGEGHWAAHALPLPTEEWDEICALLEAPPPGGGVAERFALQIVLEAKRYELRWFKPLAPVHLVRLLQLGGLIRESVMWEWVSKLLSAYSRETGVEIGLRELSTAKFVQQRLDCRDASMEEATKFPAGRVEGALFTFRPVVEQRTSFAAHRFLKTLARIDSSLYRVQVGGTDQFAPEQPKVIDMAADGFCREA